MKGLVPWLFAYLLLVSLVILLFIGYVLLPYIGLMGYILLFVFLMLMVCILFLSVAFTYVKINEMLAGMRNAGIRSHVIAEGEVVVYLWDDGVFEHLSAEHERAKAFAGTKVNIKEEVGQRPFSPEAILEMYRIGNNERDIAERLGLEPALVRRVLEGARVALPQSVQATVRST